MRVRTSPSDRAALVELSGDLDLAVADRLRLTLLSATTGRDLVVVDLADVAFMDSTAIGVVMAAWRRMRDHDGVLAVARPRPDVARILSLVGLLTVLLVEELTLSSGLDEELAALSVA